MAHPAPVHPQPPGRPGDHGEAGGAGVVIREVAKVFPTGVAAVAQVSLAIAAGEFVAILGPSGCGKSTLLRLIAGLDAPTQGRIDLQGLHDAAHARRRAIAYVFQDAHLLPWRNVLHNVALPLELIGAPRRSRLDAARQAIEQVGLADAQRRYPAQLSGGMRMRVSLARALVTQPRLLLLDEPFAALDELTRQRLDEQLRDLWIRRRMTVIFVTHSIAEAAFLADRAVVFSARPARLMLDQPLDLPLERRESLRTEPHFAAQMKRLYAALHAGGG